ncbi:MULTISPECIES: hypothetical protein [Bacillaceae]|uniref:Uncharacterized protein n=1 Tax=Peribacillus huizhouensis TaxID=1501239 RepID=A0ABR6CR84_9BACI|nr:MULTISPECIES: hypothetical protein [Bacillaceae]MBA9027470.1 hypothetical protein [Peribacillus huizhouensis]
MSIYSKANKNDIVVVRKPKVKIPDVSLSPHTKKVMEQNERIMLNYKAKAPRLKRLREIW